MENEKLKNHKVRGYAQEPENCCDGLVILEREKRVLDFGLGQVYKLNDLSLYLVPCPHISNKLKNRISEYSFLRIIIFNFDLIC